MTPPIMAKDTRRFGVSIVLAAALFAACSKEAKKGPDSAALGADSSLNRDLAMANRDSAAKPEVTSHTCRSCTSTTPGWAARALPISSGSTPAGAASMNTRPDSLSST